MTMMKWVVLVLNLKWERTRDRAAVRLAKSEGRKAAAGCEGKHRIYANGKREDSPGKGFSLQGSWTSGCIYSLRPLLWMLRTDIFQRLLAKWQPLLLWKHWIWSHGSWLHGDMGLWGLCFGWEPIGRQEWASLERESPLTDSRAGTVPGQEAAASVVQETDL